MIFIAIAFAMAARAAPPALERHLHVIRTHAFSAEPPESVLTAVTAVDDYIRQGVQDFARGQETVAAAELFSGSAEILPPVLALLIRVVRLSTWAPLRQKAHNACVAAQLMLNAAGSHAALDRVNEALRQAMDDVTNCSLELRDLRPPERFQ